MNKLRMSLLVLCVAVFAGACGASAASLPQPLAGVSIVLDPGHGGSDPGAVGAGGLKESVTNLRVARYLAMLLERDGAQVRLTRDTDIFLSLQARVEVARKAQPDLFVSIHHNASLRPGAPNKGEIYFNALDRGIPLSVGTRMRQRLEESSIGTATTLIPGGFYVLRENPAPSLLTEAAYISVPEIEKKLRTGRALVDQARAFQLAIRQAFETTPLRLEVIGKKPATVTTPYFQLLVSASRPLAKLETRMEPAFRAGFSLDLIPAFGHVYTLSNSQPINSGDYTLLISGKSIDGGQSTQLRIPLSVRLPVDSAVILPVAPYIPEGFAGSFPVTIQMLDPLERPNQRPIEFRATCLGKVHDAVTGPDGRAGIAIPLTGTERAEITIEIEAEGRRVGVMPIALKPADENIVIGRVGSALTGKGLDRVTVVAETGETAMTNPDGYFFVSAPQRPMNLKLGIAPVTGYLPTETRLKLDGYTAQQPQIVLAPRAPGLLGRRIGIIAERDQDTWVRPLVKSLMQGGARVRRLPLGSGLHPEYDAVAAANLEGGYDLLVAMKSGTGKSIALRHYHRSQTGKRLASSIIAHLGAQKRNNLITAAAGSDYELGHTAAAALVVETPSKYSDTLPGTFAAALTGAMPEAFTGN
ncbi:MAG TPA: N-acetylmuramoyl-L-alanine amidase [Candidatus Ozemobacteraceae bacterium]|nr:N-acetylmuramoyl-L-alanine amidase [Candidatus Ozemobacteraceae bacterium]